MEKGNQQPTSFYLDGIDKIILAALMENARIPIAQIANQVGISSPAVHNRIKKLEHSGLINPPITPLNHKALGYKTIAFIGVFLDQSSQYKEAIAAMQKIPQVVEAYYTTGNYSIFIKIVCKDSEHLMQVLNRDIQGIKGITRTETFISLEQAINRQIAP